MFVISGGNAWDGLVLYGPFDEMEDAHEWAENHLDEWHCILVNSVTAPIMFGL